MNEEQHIIKFDYNKTSTEYDYCYDSMKIYETYELYNIYYETTLNIIYCDNNINYNIYFDLSIILYKIHNRQYFCRYNHGCKELI